LRSREMPSCITCEKEKKKKGKEGDKKKRNLLGKKTYFTLEFLSQKEYDGKKKKKGTNRFNAPKKKK